MFPFCLSLARRNDTLGKMGHNWDTSFDHLPQICFLSLIDEEGYILSRTFHICICSVIPFSCSEWMSVRLPFLRSYYLWERPHCNLWKSVTNRNSNENQVCFLWEIFTTIGYVPSTLIWCRFAICLFAKVDSPYEAVLHMPICHTTSCDNDDNDNYNDNGDDDDDDDDDDFIAYLT